MTLKKKLAAALAAAGLAAGLSLAWPGTARATDIPTAGQWAEIFNPYLHAKGNTLCFDDPNGSTSDGTQVQLYRCHGYASNGAPQRWVFVQAEDRNGNPVTEGGNNVYELYNLAAGRCLAVTATRVAQPLILTSCVTTSTSVALWELRPTTPASHDFQLALWLYDDWCIGANDFNDNSPPACCSLDAAPATPVSCGTSGSASSAFTPHATNSWLTTFRRFDLAALPVCGPTCDGCPQGRAVADAGPAALAHGTCMERRFTLAGRYSTCWNP